MADLNIRFAVRISPRMFQWGLVGLLLSVMATELSSESVTLSTYYPAPSGVYTQMLTTGATWLARDSGNAGIGTANPNAKLAIAGVAGQEQVVVGDAGCGNAYGGIGFGSMAGCSNYAFLGDGTNTFLNRPTGGAMYFREGNTNEMTIASGGNVGINTTSPGAALDIESTAGAVNLKVNGRLWSTSSGGMWVTDPQTEFVGDVGGNEIGFWNNGAWRLYINNGGDTIVPGSLTASTAGCSQVSTSYGYATNGGITPLCAGASYVTAVGGVMSDLQQLGAAPSDDGYPDDLDPNVTVLCCPCAPTGCQLLP